MLRLSNALALETKVGQSIAIIAAVASFFIMVADLVMDFAASSRGRGKESQGPLSVDAGQGEAGEHCVAVDKNGFRTGEMATMMTIIDQQMVVQKQTLHLLHLLRLGGVCRFGRVQQEISAAFGRFVVQLGLACLEQACARLFFSNPVRQYKNMPLHGSMVLSFPSLR